MMATLLFSLGVPMLLSGDELSHTQNGNNNAYCHDDEISWLNWSLDERGEDFLEFTRNLIRIRNAHPVLRRRRFFHGREIRGTNIRDIYWLNPDGHLMEDTDWQAVAVSTLGVFLTGSIDDTDERGEVIKDDHILILLNAHFEPIEFRLPERAQNFQDLEVLFNTASPKALGQRVSPKAPYILEARSMAMFRLPNNAAG